MRESLFHAALEFSQTYKVGNVGIIANFVFPYICSFLLYLHQLMLVNVKLEIKGCRRIIFQGYNALWGQLTFNGRAKQSWQWWYSCVVESLWKTPLGLLSIEGLPCPSRENDQVGRRLAPRKEQTGNTWLESLIRNIDAFPSQDGAGGLPSLPRQGAGLLVISLVKDTYNTDANNIAFMW